MRGIQFNYTIARPRRKSLRCTRVDSPKPSSSQCFTPHRTTSTFKQPSVTDFTDSIQVTNWRERTAKNMVACGLRLSAEREKNPLFRPRVLSTTEQSATETRKESKQSSRGSRRKARAPRGKVYKEKSPRLSGKTSWAVRIPKLTIKGHSGANSARGRKRDPQQKPSKQNLNINQSARIVREIKRVARQHEFAIRQTARSTSYRPSTSTRSRGQAPRFVSTPENKGTETFQERIQRKRILRVQKSALQKSQMIDINHVAHARQMEFDYTPRGLERRKSKEWTEVEKVEFPGSIDRFEREVLDEIMKARIMISGGI